MVMSKHYFQLFKELYTMTDLVCSILPTEKPRYLMGVGTPVNILECISMGVDMFDCVMPSRNARHGMLFTSEGIINIKNEKWELDFSPLDPNGTAYVDQVYTKAYLRHLVKAKENLAGTFSEWKDKMIPKLKNRL